MGEVFSDCHEMLDLAVKQHQPEGRIAVDSEIAIRRLNELIEKYPKHEDLKKWKAHAEEIGKKIDPNAMRSSAFDARCPWDESNYAQLWVNWHYAKMLLEKKDYGQARSMLQNVEQNYEIMLKPDRMKEYPEDLRKWVEDSKEEEADKMMRGGEGEDGRVEPSGRWRDWSFCECWGVASGCGGDFRRRRFGGGSTHESCVTTRIGDTAWHFETAVHKTSRVGPGAKDAPVPGGAMVPLALLNRPEPAADMEVFGQHLVRECGSGGLAGFVAGAAGVCGVVAEAAGDARGRGGGCGGAVGGSGRGVDGAVFLHEGGPAAGAGVVSDGGGGL